jgi:hypothetical protein
MKAPTLFASTVGLILVLACSGVVEVQDRPTLPYFPASEVTTQTPATAAYQHVAWFALVGEANADIAQERALPHTTGPGIYVPDPTQGQGWEGVPQGTKLRVVSVDGAATGTFSGLVRLPFGCDDASTAFAMLDLDRPMTPGPGLVGLRPDAQPLAITTSGEQSATVRTFDVGHDLRLTLTLATPTTGRAQLARGSDVLLARTWTVPDLDGLAANPVTDLREYLPDGAPSPTVAAFQGGETILVLSTASHGGTRHEVLRIAESGETQVVQNLTVIDCWV